MTRPGSVSCAIGLILMLLSAACSAVALFTEYWSEFTVYITVLASGTQTGKLSGLTFMGIHTRPILNVITYSGEKICYSQDLHPLGTALNKNETG